MERVESERESISLDLTHNLKNQSFQFSRTFDFRMNHCPLGAGYHCFRTKLLNVILVGTLPL